MTEPWVRISGAGPVGLACALFMLRRGVPASRILLDPAPGSPQSLAPGLAARVLAISEGSCQLLSRIIELPAAGLISRVEVSLRGHLGRTRIDATDLDVSALGRVMRYGSLLEALRQRASLHQWSDAPAITGPVAVTVHAEGDTGDDAHIREFHQSALLGEVHAPRAPASRQSVAFERFTPNGPLALLPLPEPGRWAMVWCDSRTACEARRDCDPQALALELQSQAGSQLGSLQVSSPLTVVDLRRRSRRKTVSHDAAWIGNAAQSLHPVAGQGLNLGLRDAFELADALAQACRGATSVPAALQAWHAQRQQDRQATTRLTDLMASSFTWPLARPLQSPLLAALDASPALRRPLAARLMFGRR